MPTHGVFSVKNSTLLCSYQHNAPEKANDMHNHAVIFDIDGVLVDSYESHYQSWKLLAENHGRTCSESDFADQFGRTTREVLEAQWADANLSEDNYRKLDDEKEDLYRQIIATEFPEMPHARALIHNLHQIGWHIALGSSGPVENVNLAIEKLGIQDQIQAAISGNDVSCGKPDPEVFLIAAERIQVPVKNCVVIEDATHGIEAARAAGMKSIGFVSRGRTKEELKSADLLIDHLEQVTPELLMSLLWS